VLLALCDHTIVSTALGTGLRLAEIVGLDVGDVFAPDGTPRMRVLVRPSIGKGGRASSCPALLKSHQSCPLRKPGTGV
jgi:integrase